MRNLTEGKPVKNLMLFTFPIFAGNILQQLYNVTDSVIVGRVAGKDALAAVGTSQPIFMILVAVIMGLNISTEIMLSKAIGAKDHDKANKIANTMFFSVMLVSFVIGITGAIFSKQLLIFINTPVSILEDASVYLMIIFLGVPGLAGYNTLNGMIRSTGNTVLPLIFLAIASILNIVLDILFIRYFNWGVVGVAFATILAQSISFLLCYANLERLNPDLRLRLNLSRVSMKIVQRGVKLGVPASIELSAMSLSLFVIQAFVNKLHQTDIISAYTIGMKVDAFAALPVMSLSMAMVTIIGQNRGAGNKILLKKYEKYGKLGGLIFGIAMTVIMQLFGPAIVTIFISGDETEVIRYGSMYIKSLSTMYILVTYFEVSFGIIKGEGKTYIPMIISIIGVWCIRVPLAWLLIQKYGFLGICLAIPLAWAAIFVLTVIYQWIQVLNKNRERSFV